VDDRLGDLYALAQGEVLDEVRFHPSRTWSLMTVNQVLAIFTIKTAMLVFGIMEVSINSHGDKNRTHHLKLEPTWDAAHRSVGP
jgi:hypothetical protein